MVTPKLSIWSVTCALGRPTLATMQATAQEQIFFLCIESSSQNGNWTLPLLGNWENQPRCKLYRWISHAKSVVAKPKDQGQMNNTLTKCWDKNRHCLCLRRTLQDDLFLSLLFSRLSPCPSKSGLCASSSAVSPPSSPDHHHPFVLFHVVLRSSQSGLWRRRAKCDLTHTLDSLALTTLEARHPQAVYDLNSDLPCVRETRQLYRTSLHLEWSYSFMWFKKKIEMTFN